MSHLVCSNPECKNKKLSLEKFNKNCGKCGSPMIAEELSALHQRPKRPEHMNVQSVKKQFPDQVAEIESAAFARGRINYQDGFADAVKKVKELADLMNRCLRKDGQPRSNASQEDLQRMATLKQILAAAAQ